MFCLSQFVTHQASSWRYFIFISPKYIPPRLTGILDFNYHNYFTSVNLQEINSSYVPYSYYTKTLIWAVVKPRVPWSVSVKTLIGTGVETCTGFVLACEAPAHCTMVETCGSSVGGFWSASGESSHDADINYIINRCKNISLPHHLSCTRSMAVFFNFPL